MISMRQVTTPTFVSGPTMLAGIAKCGHPDCGHALTIATGKGGRYRYYRCSRNLRRGATACQGTSIRDEKLESIVINAMAERLLQPARFQELLANLLDDSSAATRERQAHLKALRTERTRVDGASQNMFDFIEQGIVSPRDHFERAQTRRERMEDFDSLVMLCRDLGIDAKNKTEVHHRELSMIADAPADATALVRSRLALWRADMTVIYVCLNEVPHYEVRNPAFSTALTRLWMEGRR